MNNRRPGDWWPCYGPDTPEADVPRLAARKLKVPEADVEMKWTGGCWLARERQEKEKGAQ